MAQASIQATPGTGPQVDFRTVGATPYFRQVLAVGDPATDTAVAPVTAAGGLRVDVSGIAAAQAALPAWGHGANGVAAPGSSTLIGLRVANALPAVATLGQMVPPLADLYGRLITVPLAPRELVADNTITLTTTTETTLIAATAAEFHDLTVVVCSNASTTIDTRVDVRDTTGGTVRFSLFVPAKATVGFQLPTPRAQAVVNTNWTAQCGTTGADVRIYAQYLKNK